MFVLGTAGHIDHGKSALVRALTGIDPDRLPEEKERGMTLDLGFSWLKLPGGQEVGIVDVPGHERLIKNMVAGVGGIDLALLIIAANEGIMPQTREHLAILDLLGVKRGVIVITKKDLVDDDWLALVTDEVRKAVAPTGLAGAPLVAVSSVTGAGLPELVRVIEGLLGGIPPKPDLGRPRLPIDRAFTIAGSGTVVTGTLVDGSLKVGQEIEIVPGGTRSRIRGLQSHKSRQEVVGQGSRVGVNLVGVAKTQIERGNVLTTPGWLKATTALIGELRLIPYLRYPLKHNATASFHTGTAHVMAKVRLLEGAELKPGGPALAYFSLDGPVALVKGDRFIIRSPDETLGGGEVVESQAGRYRRLAPGALEGLRVRARGTTGAAIMSLLEKKQPLGRAVILSQSERPASEVEPALAALVEKGEVVSLGEGEARVFFTKAGWERQAGEVTRLVGDYHQAYPSRSGMPRAELASRLGAANQPSLILRRLAEEGVIKEEGSVVRLPSHEVRLSPAQQARVDAFLKALSENPHAPNPAASLEPELLNLLVARRQVVKVAEGVVFSARAYDEMVAKITAHLKGGNPITVGQVRDMFQTSRKYAVALLEYLDGARVTRRVGDERVLY